MHGSPDNGVEHIIVQVHRGIHEKRNKHHASNKNYYHHGKGDYGVDNNTRRPRGRPP